MIGQQAISLVGFADTASVKAFIEAWPQAKFELAYNMGKDFLDDVSPFLADRVVSVHSCCPVEPFFPNFASSDLSILKESHAMLARSAATAIAFGAQNVVLHPGYVTDQLVPSDVHQRMALLRTGIFKDFTGGAAGTICRDDYPLMPAYRRRFGMMKRELAELGSAFARKQLCLAVENLNPRAGYVCMTDEEMVEIAAIPDVFLCLDVGHLWISHLVFGFPFLEAIRRILSTGKVVSCHLHSNPSQPNGMMEDSHEDFDANGFPCRMIVDVVRMTGANMVLETLKHPLHNVQVLSQLVANG